MSASRYFLQGTSLFRATTNPYKPLLSSIPPLPFLSSNPFPSFPFPARHRSSSSSSSAAAVTLTADDAPVPLPERQPHPWPEWVTFVDRLKSKGYFAGDASAESVYTDVNQLKDPCLSFARDRYDVFKSLSVPDIQTVVEGGCPNLLRKSVNSAKRLRAHLRLDEAEVCSQCNLRGSCDRAYVILKDNESDARTVDIVRLLLVYALDPLVFSGEKSPDRGLIEASVRKLLSEMIELSETERDPSLPKPSLKVSQKEPRVNYDSDKLSRDVEMKRGDWMCPKCDFMNFARNLRCLNCNEEGPKKVGGDDVVMKKGDWICPECSFMNFSRNFKCLKCKAEGPLRAGVNDQEMKKGDWNCSKCGFMNFANKKACLRCRETRPKRELLPGDWECPKCDYLNYSRNAACKKCNEERPKEAVSEYDEQLWKEFM
ncbi:hypothetical protein Tsubulata_020440 [Turnera subulata]|uniref:RanBP2-type domain-containing protein n=1 Tax=Turnera subulata TaxID=218843 RepID=A0A9Q0GDS8_9ROSI|nr:hypothetical protein Tsubulata_020440 [Turnera subulata]